MAQAFFDGHPLEEYLKDSGEASEPIMPGGIAEFALQLFPTVPNSPPKYSERVEKLCYLILGLSEFVASLFSSDRTSKRTQAFAERFKYGVISSTLLSPAFPSTPLRATHRRSISPSIPGKLSGNHSRSESLAESVVTVATDTLSLTIPPEPETPLWPATLSFTVSIAALSARFYFLLDLRSKHDVMTPSLEALQNLISAGRVWDSVINDAFNLLESEERSSLYGSTPPTTPSSALRVALSSSLLTTQTQCDNVRQLLSAVASPTELSQLTEMYAPPSPSPLKSAFSLNTEVNRPLSHPGSPQRREHVPNQRKRSTWNGSYSALASAGSPPAFQIARRQEKRRSDLTALLGVASPPRGSLSGSLMSASPLRPIADVSEEDSMVAVNASFASDADEEPFGAAALDLRRKRQSDGLRTFELPPRSAPSSLSHASILLRHRATMTTASKYTSMPATRHPLSLSALHQSMHGALASKRFACSHLLALRFEDDEEVYWEDVRSLMALLTSALVDASTRLSEALDEVEDNCLRPDDSATEDPSGIDTPSSLASPPRRCYKPSQSLSSLNSFAPLPSHLARFAAHVDTISTALNDAREHLEQCVASLKEDVSPVPSPHLSASSTSTAGEHPAVQAYERLRRELGIALRECERGRERLVHIVSPPAEEEDADANDEDEIHTAPEAVVKLKEEGDPPEAGESDVSMTVVLPDGETVVDMPDDVTAHLLFTASAEHLPPLGVEQVYEADTTGVGTFTRERSRLSREERITLAKARREAAANGSSSSSIRATGTARCIADPDSPSPKMERWGPGGEVVQELKDVIWKVGERRRKMTEGQFRSVVSNASSSLPSSPKCTVGPVNILPQSSTPS
ncbi:hypothetical protein ID866_3096 [Astraeus odoratus]|nr:hypothetical protein ID866_3096 [Astraeus odoratus]